MLQTGLLPEPISTERGNWMQTYTGRVFYPTSPLAEEIDPVDIAHSLSLQCRYGGHVDRFYSVAEHCVLMSEWVAPENALYALLHDATEAYVSDVPRPLKGHLPEYKAIEDRVWDSIAEYFKIDRAIPEQVWEADNRILLTERAELLSKTKHKWFQDGKIDPLPVQVTGWYPKSAEVLYLQRLEELLNA
jgi:hypothetical protein